MKILKYNKQKNGMYQVFFDNDNNVDIHEEIILKYGLLIKKEVDHKELDKMLDENKKYLAYNLALKHLSSKMRTIKEIREYLNKNMFDKDTIDEVIELLVKEKYLDDSIYSKAFINDKILLSNDGPNKIRNKLIELGVDKDIIEDNIVIFTDDIQKEKIKKIADKQVAINRNKSAYTLKSKINDYLYNLGYSKILITEYVSKLSIKDDEDLVKKEYDKVYKKLSKKYSGSELEYKVKQKMYSLGFNYHDE